MAILISESKLRRLLDDAYMTGRVDERVAETIDECSQLLQHTVDALMKKAIEEEAPDTGSPQG